MESTQLIALMIDWVLSKGKYPINRPRIDWVLSKGKYPPLTTTMLAIMMQYCTTTLVCIYIANKRNAV